MKRTRKKVQFNQNLVLDSIGALLIVLKIPELANRFLFASNPVTGLTATAVGVGANYLLAQMVGRPDMANVGIGAGAVAIVSPMIDELIGMGKPLTSLPMNNVPGVSPGAMLPNVTDVSHSIEDFITLNDYINNPMPATGFDQYKGIY